MARCSSIAVRWAGIRAGSKACLATDVTQTGTPPATCKPKSASLSRRHHGGEHLGMLLSVTAAEYPVDLLARKLQPANRVRHEVPSHQIDGGRPRQQRARAVRLRGPRA